jgi:hypothetical protein
MATDRERRLLITIATAMDARAEPSSGLTTPWWLAKIARLSGLKSSRSISAQPRRSTSEDDRASTSLQHHARTFSSKDEATEAANTPHRLEIGALRGQQRSPYRVPSGSRAYEA